jgi:dolichol-phosphate mannosyltransferase
VGLARASGAWVLTIDADCTVESGLTRSLASFAEKTDVVALSVATRQSAPGLLYAMLHPSLLTTLVYRFGPPGYKTTNPKDVLANGQCFFASKDALQASGALRSSLQSLCEDITIARTLASTGHRVGFFEAERSVRVEMYSSAAEAWKNWPRSLVMRDQYFDHSAVLQLARVCLVQAAPLPLAVLAAFSGFPAWFLLAQAVLLALRIGVLVGTRKAYIPRAGSFWLSPLLDLPVALRLIQVTFQRRFVWRGRAYVREDNGSVVAVDDQVTS